METTIASVSLVNDVIEEIFLRLPVKSLIRFKSLSKQWRLKIESHSFAVRQLKIAKRSKVMTNFRQYCSVITSSLSNTFFNIIKRVPSIIEFSESCDGLFCIRTERLESIFVCNPATHWFRQLPPARWQILMKYSETYNQEDFYNYFLGQDTTSYIPSPPELDIAFVKATDYKLVWLYNSNSLNSDSSSPNDGVITKCEVFDFSANTWRYLTCTPNYQIFARTPASLNGSVYWFTNPANNDEVKVVALDIYTETFRVLPKINPNIASLNPREISMFVLDDGLCMWKEYEMKKQDIWKMKSSEDIWEKIYIIDSFSSSYRIQEISNWILQAMCISKNEIMLKFTYGYKRVYYNLEEKRLYNLEQEPYIIFVPCIQTLISHI